MKICHQLILIINSIFGKKAFSSCLPSLPFSLFLSLSLPFFIFLPFSLSMPRVQLLEWLPFRIFSLALYDTFIHRNEEEKKRKSERETFSLPSWIIERTDSETSPSSSTLLFRSISLFLSLHFFLLLPFHS